jgi:hypothetical protein
LSALSGVLTVACVYALGRALFAPGVGALAALLVAINAFSVYYGQEARMYALLQLVAAADMLAFVHWLKQLTHRQRARPYLLSFLALAVLNAAGLYVHYAYPAVLAAQGVLFLLWAVRRRDLGYVLRDYVILNLISLVLFLPQAETAVRQITNWPRTGQPVDPGTGIATVAQWLIYGNTLSTTPWWMYIWPGLFMVAGLLPDWRKGHALPAWWRRLFPITTVIVILGLFFGMGMFREANLKFLLPAELAVALLIGRGLWMLWEIGTPNPVVLIEMAPRLVAALGLIALLSFSRDALSALYHDPLFARDNYRAIAALIDQGARPGDAIILDAPNQREVFTYYLRSATPLYELPQGLGGDDAATIAQTEQVIAGHRRIFVLYWGETERDPHRVVEKTLAARAFEVSGAWYGNVRLVRYAALPEIGAPTPMNIKFGEAITLDSVALSSTQAQPGDVLGVSLIWRTATPLATRYKVTVQILDSAGSLVTQHDAEPGNNMALTTTWQPGQPVTDTYGLLLPLTLAPGEYTVIVGLYDMNNPANRLPVGTSDHALIGRVRIF